MKYIKEYKEIKSYPKYLLIKPNNMDERYYIVTCDENLTDFMKLSDLEKTNIYFDKIYTLYPNNKIKRNKHQTYSLDIKDLDKHIIYSSNNLKDAYDILASIYDSKKYNL
jgi:hypothetical protein